MGAMKDKARWLSHTQNRPEGKESLIIVGRGVGRYMYELVGCETMGLDLEQVNSSTMLDLGKGVGCSLRDRAKT